ncbi:hypothetical protein [Streptomyces sp.]|uniref:hypothetical protein n=1 Tax=Streptomyces sp. TaxID=1931 RepID=UPI002F958CCD
MTWFKVDDSFHSHPKVLATDPAALGLWVVAGAWSSANLTGGFVPDRALPRLVPDGASLAKELVAAGLWKRSKGGYLFHDWTDYNPTAEEEREKRAKRAEAGRKGGLASGRTRSKTRSKGEANASGGASRTVEAKVNPVPVPSPKGTGTDTTSQSSSRRNARAWAEDDDSIDLGIVELLAELTGRQVSILDATKIRQRILGNRQIRTSRAAYVAAAIEDNPGKFLPAAEAVERQADASPLKVVPEWCGHCHSDGYRWLELADGRWDKCPACNPTAKDPFASKEVS